MLFRSAHRFVICSVAEPSSFYPEEPAFVAGCVYKFSIEDINQNSEARLLITSPEGKELEFAFDLVNVK